VLQKAAKRSNTLDPALNNTFKVLMSSDCIS